MIKTLRNLLKQDKERFIVPRGVQDVIPIKAIYDDGIFQVGRDKQGRKGLEETKRNVAKAKDGVQKFREKRATESMKRQTVRSS